MISFTLNNKQQNYTGDPEKSLLDFLRFDKHITSVKDGCSAQAACGACTVEINGKAMLSCVAKMSKLNDAEVNTPEGFPPYVLDIIAKAMVNKGAVQCGFCTPGFISRTKVLLQNTPNPSIEEIQKAIKPHICRCTGYKKIEEAIQYAGEVIQRNEKLVITSISGKVGISHPKYEAYSTAIGARDFVDDIFIDGMLFGALKFRDHPRAKIISIDTSKASNYPGVQRVFTAKDILGVQKVGLIIPDWPVMVGIGQITSYIGDVLAGVVADTNKIAREAIELIDVKYDVLEPITDVFKAMNADRIHEERPNNFETTSIKIGKVDKALMDSKYYIQGNYETQRVEHGFMEKESSIAVPEKDGIHLYSQSQGIYEDQRQVAMILGLDEKNVRVTLVPNGGGFGGKEDLSIQGQTALFSFLTNIWPTEFENWV